MESPIVVVVYAVNFLVKRCGTPGDAFTQKEIHLCTCRVRQNTKPQREKKRSK